MKSSLAAGLVLLMATAASAESPLAHGVHPRTFTSSRDGSVEPYNLYIPGAHDGTKALPLVVALHGKGATWQSWFAGTPVEEWAEQEGFIVITPHGRGDWFYLGPGEQDVFDSITDVKSLCRVDDDRIYLLGHSMGGWGAWHLAASHPDLFAAVVPMATWPPDALLPNLRPLEPLVIHGDADAVVPVEWSRRAVKTLELLEIPHRYIEAPGVGHESKLIGDSFPAIGDWIRDRRRVSDPPTVTLRAYTPRRGKAWWVQLQEVERFTRLASIDAAVSERQIDVVTDNVRDFSLDPPLTTEQRSRAVVLMVDGQRLSVPPLPVDQVIFLRRVGAQWGARLAPRSEFRAPAAKPLGQLTAPADKLAERLILLVAQQMDADLAIVPRDLLAPGLKPGPLNEDDVLDLFLRPEDELCRVKIPAADRDRLTGKADWYPAYWGGLAFSHDPATLPAEGVIHAVVPRILATKLPYPAQGTGLSIRELFHDQIRHHGGLDIPVKEGTK